MIRSADDDIIYDSFSGINVFSKPTKCSNYLIVLFSEGCGTHRVDGKEYAIRKKQLHFLFPGQQHQWETGPNTKAQRLTVGKKMFEAFSSINEFRIIQLNLPPIFKINDRLYSAIYHELKGIESTLKLLALDKQWQNILYRKIDTLTSLIKQESERVIEAHLANDIHPHVRQFWNMVSQHFIDHKNTGWYASKLNVTSNYLNILCKRSLNTSASEIILLRIIQEAKIQLKSTNKIVKEIAFELGFKTISSFSAFFKKRTGLTPLEYRDEIGT